MNNLLNRFSLKNGAFYMAFMDYDFLLDTSTAKILYHEYAAKMPIIDYHCHIDAREILENKQFSDLSDAWLGGDHYKWRLIRANGTAEKYVTGDASGFEKFMAFAEVMPNAIGNPVYHWAHLELQRFFGCKKPLCPENAQEIWDSCNYKLQNNDRLRVRGIIDCMRVEVIVTTDDPIDDLESHKKLAADESFKTKVLPGWRPGTIMDIETTGFPDYIKKLREVTGSEIEDFAGLKSALLQRIEYFNEAGCRTADHGLHQLTYAPADDGQIDDILKKGLSGETVKSYEADRFRYALMIYLGKEYAKLDWVTELHVGVMRNVNTVMLDKVGANTGFDCIDPDVGIADLAKYLNELNIADALPKTLIFSINPIFDSAINTLAGSFPKEGIKSRVQQGSAWWFNDTFYGMEQQMKAFAEGGVLANFVGMLTDSRSFLSYPRHEYFRRILCNLIGGWVDSGKYPADMITLEKIIKNICYNNTKTFFGF